MHPVYITVAFMIGLPISILAIFVSGIARKIKKKSCESQAWWLKNLSIWTVLWGAFCYTAYWIPKWSMMAGGVGFMNNELFRFKSISALNFTIYLGTAVAAWTFALILGRNKETANRVAPTNR